MEKNSLESRVETLERQNRLFRRASIAIAALALASITVAFRNAAELTDAQFRIVSASKFQVVDPRTGKTRAQLAHQTVPGGWAGMTLWDEAGKPRAELKLWEDGTTRLIATAADGTAQWELSSSADGKSKVEVGGHEVVTR
jgi:hypothetical protein